MFDDQARNLRMLIVILLLWVISAAATWFFEPPVAKLIGLRQPNTSLGDLAVLDRLDLASERDALQKTLLWGMQRDGQVVKAKEPTVTIEKKVVWSVVAIVIRPKQRYLLIRDQDTKGITQINEGDKLPDGSKLLKVAFNSYLVQMADGQKRAMENRF